MPETKAAQKAIDQARNMMQVAHDTATKQRNLVATREILIGRVARDATMTPATMDADAATAYELAQAIDEACKKL